MPGCADDLFEEIHFVTTDFSGESSCEISVFSSLPEHSVKSQVSLLEICGQGQLTAPRVSMAETCHSLRQFPLRCASSPALHCAAGTAASFLEARKLLFEPEKSHAA